MTRRLLLALSLLLALAPAAGAQAVPGPAPQAVPGPAPQVVVEHLQATLLAAMQDAARLGFAGRRALLTPVVSEAYDFPAVARVSAGPDWARWSPADQARLIQLVGEVAIATYADRFNGFGGERFEVLAVEPGQRGTTIVRSRIVRPNDAPVALDYVLAQRPQGWRIIDVLLDGKFSELARQRADYGAVLQQSGYDGLVRELQAQLDRMAPG